jgi:hypothetical protein
VHQLSFLSSIVVKTAGGAPGPKEYLGGLVKIRTAAVKEGKGGRTRRGKGTIEMRV